MNVNYILHPNRYLNVKHGSPAYRFLTFSTLAGAVFPMLHMGEVIARKSLGSEGILITFLSMTMPIASIASIWWARLLVGRNQAKFLLYTGIVAYLALLTGIFLDNMAHMLAMYMIFFLANALTIPATNRILQQHITPSRIGRLVGVSSGLRMGLAVVMSFGAGKYMDAVEGGFRHIYAVAAVAGAIGIWQLSRIQTQTVEGSERQYVNKSLFLNPIKKVIQLLRRRKDFFRFEIAFMFYGIAFMMTLPVVPLYIVDDLGLSYTEIGLAKGTVPQLIMLICMPIFGRWFDRTTPHRLSVIIFMMLSLYPVLLLTAGKFEGSAQLLMVFVAFGTFGVAMSGVLILWSLSSMRFAGNEDAGVYHSVHAAATGVRGLFAPMLGYVVMTYFGKSTALLCSSAIWLFASALMLIMRRIDVKRGEAHSLMAGKID